MPGTCRPVAHILLNERCSLNSRRLLICNLLMRCSEHRFKLHLVQQPKETVSLKKKQGGETPLCVEGGRPSRPGRAGAGSCLPGRRRGMAAVNTFFLE